MRAGMVVGAEAVLSLWEVREMNVLEAKFLAASLLQIIELNYSS